MATIKEGGQQYKPEIQGFFKKSWLANQVAVERHRPQETPPWYHLNNFFVREQVSQFVRNTTGAMAEIAPDVLALELAKVRVDVLSFEKEYLEQMLTLRFALAWEGEGEDRHIVCPEYGRVSWRSVADTKEREGAVTEALFGNDDKTDLGVEDFLRDAPPDSFAVIVSPQGWSGLENADGDQIRFPETQVYTIRTLADGSLQAYTFRYEADIYENEHFQELLGLGVVFEPDQKQRIKNALKNTALIRGDDPNRKIKSFEDVIGFMQQSVDQREIAYEGKSFAEFRQFLQDPDRYATTNPYTEQMIRRFNQYTASRIVEGGVVEDIEKDLQIALALTIIQINGIYRETEKRSNQRVVARSDVVNFIAKIPVLDYNQEKKDLEKRGGCAGGGSGDVLSMGSIRKGVVNSAFNKLGEKDKKKEESDDYEFDHKGQCVVCHKDPELLGPCDICVSCDASLGGKAAKKAA